MTKLWKKLFERMWEGQKGYAFIAYGGSGHGWKQEAFLFPDHLDLMLKEAESANKWTNVYFCPHLFKSPKNKKKENAAPVSTLWIDMDAGSWEEIDPKPTYCWITSEGKHHAVWILDKAYDPQEAEKVIKYLTYKTPGGDRGCWNLGRVIRFPGSLNYKYEPPYQGELLWDDGPVYSLEDLSPAIPEEMESAFDLLMEQKTPEAPDIFPPIEQVLIMNGPLIPKVAWEMLARSPRDDEDVSAGLWKVERLLLEAGVSAAHTFAIVRESKWNKYKRDGRPNSHLWQEVYKAAQEKGPFQDSPEDLPWVTLDELMVYSEKPEWLVEGIWMQKNVGWIAGVGKSYKSVLSTDLAISVASGTPFLGKFEVMDPGPVLMVQEEDPIWRVAHRMQVICKKKGLNGMSLQGSADSMILRMSDTKIPLLISIGGGMSFSSPNRMEAVERALDKYRPKLLILDPLFMMTAGLDDFKASDISGALIKVKEWRNKYDCAIAIVHHYRKGQGSSVEKLYGSQALYAWSENNMFISRADDTNVVSIERDIKDAKRIEWPITVEFQNIDEEYRFILGVKEKHMGRRGESEDRIIAVLKNFDLGHEMTFEELTDLSGYTARTVREKITRLEKAKMISTKYKGVGGKLHIKTREPLYEEANSIMGSLILDDF